MAQKSLLLSMRRRRWQKEEAKGGAYDAETS